jgi:hypothetical protein
MKMLNPNAPHYGLDLDLHTINGIVKDLQNQVDKLKSQVDKFSAAFQIDQTGNVTRQPI